MNLQDLVGQIFQENALYEILHFDIEANPGAYQARFIHMYFDHLGTNQIQITEVISLDSEAKLYERNRQIIGEKAWIEIYDHSNHIDLMICRKDRSGKFSVIGPNINHTQAFRKKSYDIPVRRETPLTPEERREAFAELAGLFDRVEVSRPKKAV